MRVGDFTQAVATFSDFLKKYPSDPTSMEAQLDLGISYLLGGKIEESITELTKAADSRNTPGIRDSAIFYKGQAQMSQSAVLPKTDPKRQASLEATLATFTQHLKDFPNSATREDSYYGVAFANYLLEREEVLKSTVDLLLAEFPNSPNKPDYLLLIGNAYQQKVLSLSKEGKSDVEIDAATKQAVEAYEKIQASSDFLVVANEARLQTAELLFSLAKSTEDWQKIVDTYRQVKSKEVLIPAQEAVIAGISIKIREAAVGGNKALGDRLRSQLLRQKSRLLELKSKPDPVLLTIIRMAQARLKIKQYDEARVQLRHAQKFITEEQKATVSYMLILSYALQGLTQKADAAFTEHKTKFPTDPNSENISALIGGEMQKQGDYAGAVLQFRKSLEDYPQGKQVAQASVGLATCLIELKQIDEASKTLADFIAKNPQSPLRFQAQFGFAKGLLAAGKSEEAIAEFRKLASDPASGNFAASSAMQIGSALYSSKKYPEAAKEFLDFHTKFPTDPNASTALFYAGTAQQQARDLTGARSTLEAYLKEYPTGANAPAAQEALGDLAMSEGKSDLMIAAYERVTKEFPDSPQYISSSFKIAQNFEKAKDYEQAAKFYQLASQKTESPYAPVAVVRQVFMWSGAAKSLGAYPALTDEERKTWLGYMAKGELTVKDGLQRFPASREAGAGLQELVKVTFLKVNYEVMTESAATDYFKALAGEFTDPKVKARVELAGAGLMVLRGKLGEAKSIYARIAGDPGLEIFAWEDMDRYGLALMAAGDLDGALKIFETLQKTFEKEKYAQASALYGQGAIYMARKDTAQGDKFFGELEKNYGWSEKIMEAKLGRGIAAEERGDNAAARDFYQTVIRDTQPRSTPVMKARAMLGFARTLEKEGKLLPDPVDKSKPNAVNNYLKIDSLFDIAKDSASEALWRAGQIYERSNLPGEARKAYADLVKKYPQTEWVAKAQERLAALPSGK